MERKQQLQAAIKKEADLIDQYKVGQPHCSTQKHIPCLVML